MESASLEIRETGDGSHTLYNKYLDETYHSTKGALAESEKVFIESGLAYLHQRQQPLKVLEVGFGTGLNALLSLHYCQQHPSLQLHYTGLEPYPVPLETIKTLNYTRLLPHHLAQPLYAMHELSHNEQWEQENFQFQLVQTKLEAYEAEAATFSCVYFDAFAPNKQPEIWELPLLQKLYELLQPQGVLVTYCAQGQFKRNLKAAGFAVEALPGPPGKREITRAGKK